MYMNIYDKNCFENRNLITNFNKSEEPIYREAIERYGWDGLFITDDAYWRNGYKDDTMSALRFKNDNERRDLSDFWKIFDSISNN